MQKGIIPMASRVFNVERESSRSGKVKELGKGLKVGDVVAVAKLKSYEESVLRHVGVGGEMDFERGNWFIVVSRVA